MATTGSGVGQFNFTLKGSADTTISMTWLSDDGVMPMDLTGYSMALTIRPFVNSSAVVLSLNSAVSSGSHIVLGATAGTIDLVFAHADTAGLRGNGLAPNNLPGGLPVSPLGVYDLQYTDPAGNIGYLVEGSILLDPSVT